MTCSKAALDVASAKVTQLQLDEPIGDLLIQALTLLVTLKTMLLTVILTAPSISTNPNHNQTRRAWRASVKVQRQPKV